ncbi:MAG: T9SS type A sorting domain-containing protein [Cytophagaceae bacterium]
MKKLLFFLLLIPCISFAQWEKYFSGQSLSSLIETSDGGYLGVIETTNTKRLLKTNIDGDSVWSYELPFPSFIYNVSSLIKTDDKGFIWATDSSGINGLIKFSSSGQIEWRRFYHFMNQYQFHEVIMSEGNIYATAVVYYAQNQIKLYKFNSTGDTIFTKDLSQSNTAYSSRISACTGGFHLMGSAPGDNILKLVRYNHEGTVQWEKFYDEDLGWYSGAIKSNNDITVFTNFGRVYKINGSGEIQWTKDFGHLPYINFTQIHIHDSGEIVLAGDSSISMMKLSQTGDILWEKSYYVFIESLLYVKDGSYVISGYKHQWPTSAFLFKMDQNGVSLRNKISGKIYWDKNKNCTKQTTDPPLVNWLIRVSPSQRFISTDSLGNYTLDAGSGNYTLTVIPPNELWKSAECNTIQRNFTFSASDAEHLDNINFAMEGIECTLLKVNIGSNRMRRCFENPVTVHYRNDGTIPAENVEVKVELPPAAIFRSATIPHVLEGNFLKFNVGRLNPGQAGQFTIIDSVDCHVPLESTHCIKSTIGPNASCKSPDLSWDKSSVIVSGTCVNDSVEFIIMNTGEYGSGDMQGNSQYRIFINNQLSRTGLFKLKGGESMKLIMAGDAKTLRLEADQRPGHPGKSRPRATVEACGQGTPSFGFRLAVVEDDADDFIDIDCSTVIGSFDPNDKAVFPSGITERNFVKTGQEFEYLIRFQNTGTDTAFTVIIRDTLSPHLDVTTFESGASSHNYRYKITGKDLSIIEWIFPNILLPDSNVNEPASNGFVRFKIQQKENLPKGTIIENSAGIIFDFNEPVITNIVIVEVNDTIISGPEVDVVVIASSKSGLLASGEIKLYPNPVGQHATIEFNNFSNYRNPVLIITDVSGKTLHTVMVNSGRTIFSKADLLPGMYLFNVKSDDGLLENGKLIVE